MKNVFLFLASALVCIMTMTSCSKEDGAPALTNIRVEPSTITKPVGESQQVTVTKIPVDADEPVYTWTTSDASVATVSNTGLVTVTGIGTATVTVASGNVSANVAVTGTVKSVAVTDAEGNSAGTYPFDNSSEDITFTLTATVDPSNAGIKPEWSVDVNTVTVSASADGMSAQVTITGAGTAVVTVAVGGASATYTITTSSILESAVGYWTFDDPNDLFKATVGEDLVPRAYDDAVAAIAAVAGPAAGNGAVIIPDYTWLQCFHNIAPNGPVPPEPEPGKDPNEHRVNEFTIMLDIISDVDNYTALIQNHANNGNEASMYLKSSGRVGTGEISNSANGLWELNKWFRLVFSAKFVAEEGGFYNYYINGKLMTENRITMANNTRHTMNPTDIGFFTDTRPGEPYNEAGDGYDRHGPITVAGIAIWDHPLTEAEIAVLGMFAIDE
jgi:hypothetical protein